VSTRDAIDVWLLRHGEITSYEGDHGLTERGTTQARNAARALREQLDGSGAVELRHATSTRATETARHLGGELSALGVAVDGPRTDPGFDNLAVAIDGRARPHDDLRAAVAGYRHDHGAPPPDAPDWLREGDRFAWIHDGGGDPIEWWLTQPCLAYEPPARVVRRFWRALVALGAGEAPAVAVCTHSGPIRALAAEAVGRDLGEPAHLEALHVRLPAHGPARVTYRGETVPVAVPALGEPDWP
jgi:broad specificity phosphatase PhoE